MNEKFFALPDEKRRAIINAGLSVFAHNDYKKASTDEIVALAGISKGLLFHYFESKQGFYLYLYDYSIDFMMDRLGELHDYDETDFFKIIENAQLCKLEIQREHPDLAAFVIRSYYEKHGDVHEGVSSNFQSIFDASMSRLVERADASKFKDSITVEQAKNIVVWISEGYTVGLSNAYVMSDAEALNDRFLEYMEILRQHFYREEYL